MLKNSSNHLKDERGLVLSGIALLLILPSLLIASSYLTILSQGGEATSIQSIGDKVFYVGIDIENTVLQMKNYNMKINESNLDNLENKYESSTGLSVNLTLLRCEGVLKKTDYPAEGETKQLFDNYPLWGYELDAAVENNDSSLKGRENLRSNGTQNHHDDLTPPDNMSVSNGNFKVWLVVGNGEIKVVVTRQGGCISVSEDGNTVLIEVQDPGNSAKYQSKVNFWPVNE